MRPAGVLLAVISCFMVFCVLPGCIEINEGLPDKEYVRTESAGEEGVFIHVSHGPEDPHRVLMALAMAEKMSTDKNVLMYFDISGIEVLLADAADLTYSHFPSSRTQIDILLERGVGIYACPGCLKAADKTPEDLMEGIQVASKEAFFGFTDGRILTLDY
jgi:predicted peroxiredoxin